MATTNIELDIENITGVADANDQFIISAQRFVASSIPKDLLWFASTSATADDGNGIDVESSDSVLSVDRNGYPSSKVPFSMSKWIDDSTSLKKATALYPKHYDKDGKIFIKPDPDGSNTGTVQYVDYSQIDDDCDLRSAVIFHASSQEFEKLATSKITDWSDLTLPVPPSSPSFGGDLSVSAVLPSAPTLSSSTVSFNTAAPTYVKPSSPTQTAFNDYWTLGDFGDSDPEALSITAVAPASLSDPSISAPDVSSVTVSNIGTPPTYTAPTVTGNAGLTGMESGAVADATDQIEFDTWWDIVGDLIETEEDSELAAAQIQKINSYIGAYSQSVQNEVNVFNDANVEYQAKLQEAIQQAQIDAQEAQKEGDLTLQSSIQDYSLELQKYQADVGKYQADVAKEVQEYTQKLSRYQLELNTVFQAWGKTESDNLAKYQSDIQNELNNFNDNNVEYQAQLQISIQDAQLSSQDDVQKIQKYNSEIQAYQSDVNKQVQDYTNTLQKNLQEYQSELTLYNADIQKYQFEAAEQTQKISSASQNAVHYSNESKKYYDWAVAEITMYIQNNSKIINKTIAAQQQAAQQ